MKLRSFAPTLRLVSTKALLGGCGHFSFTCSARSGQRFREPKVDLVMGTSPSLFQGLSAACVALLKRRPFLLEVRDLWQDFAIEMGILNSRVLIFFAKLVEKFIYWQASHILVNSPAYANYLVENGDQLGQDSL